MRRLLWKEYGIPFGDMTIYDVLLAVTLHGSEVDRENNAAARQEIEARRKAEDNG